MADENLGNEPEPQEPPAGGQPAATDPKPGEAQAATDPEGGVLDTHGQPGINKERHDREVAELHATIAELQAQVAEAAKTEEGRADLQRQLDDLKAQMADKDVSHSLEIAGCVDEKAAKARLADFGGDVAKLRESCPYLFAKEKKTGSTGLQPNGAPGDIDAMLDKAFGLK